eukprot:CAMPEP_0171761648 /NCGR_PEP_ID=MMETSP0991-20121206/48188_1 /TAXON_ID=483369 /ORGANISM="non described non described, Strain CCMP2098" /LENGTH=174 /DNA_ID=CAMNT_0012364965 /DNA_START=29 /DNA_END=550 /DNA_ORIENTATION=+
MEVPLSFLCANGTFSAVPTVPCNPRCPYLRAFGVQGTAILAFLALFISYIYELGALPAQIPADERVQVPVEGLEKRFQGLEALLVDAHGAPHVERGHVVFSEVPKLERAQPEEVERGLEHCLLVGHELFRGHHSHALVPQHCQPVPHLKRVQALLHQVVVVPQPRLAPHSVEVL